MRPRCAGGALLGTVLLGELLVLSGMGRERATDVPSRRVSSAAEGEAPWDYRGWAIYRGDRGSHAYSALD